jgi:integrase
MWKLFPLTRFLLEGWLRVRKGDDVWSKRFGASRLVFITKDGEQLNKPYSTISKNRNKNEKILHRTRYYSRSTVQDTFRRLIDSVDVDKKWEVRTFKYLRKTGATWIAELGLDNSERLEMLYLAHKPSTITTRDYTTVGFSGLGDALDMVSENNNLDVFDAYYDERVLDVKERYGE